MGRKRRVDIEGHEDAHYDPRLLNHGAFAMRGTSRFEVPRNWYRQAPKKKEPRNR